MKGINQAVVIGKVEKLRTNKAGRARLTIVTEEQVGDGKVVRSEVWVAAHAVGNVVEGQTALVVGPLVTNYYRVNDGEARVVELAPMVMSRVPNTTPHVNQVTWAGGMVNDPDLRYSANGRARAQFTVGVGDKPQDGNGGEDTRVFLRAVVFGPFAERVAEIVTKGDRVTVTGRVQMSARTNDQTGRTYYNADLVVQDMQLPRRPSAGRPNVEADGYAAAPAVASGGDGNSGDGNGGDEDWLDA